MKFASQLLAATFALALSAPLAAQSIVVFGTSLSDSGNAFALRGSSNTPPDYSVDPLLVPDAPYMRGGHHFSNGATWVEQYARRIGSAGATRPALASSGGAANYAVGGARAREDGTSFTLSLQVRRFVADAGKAPAGALYVIEIGGNDVRDAIAAFVGGANPAEVLDEALRSIGANITDLYAAGARRFLIWNVPNLGATPAIRMLDAATPGAAKLAEGLTNAFNAGLEFEVLQVLERRLPGVQFVRLDVNAKLAAIIADPAAFGLANVKSACITPHAPPFHCDNADEFLFWDGIHPTAAAHGIIAAFAAATLGR
jgi:phospholipase/lecithinase/hemolysin